jgi:hypothetical protein
MLSAMLHSPAASDAKLNNLIIRYFENSGDDRVKNILFSKKTPLRVQCAVSGFESCEKRLNINATNVDWSDADLLWLFERYNELKPDLIDRVIDTVPLQRLIMASLRVRIS